VAVLVHLPLVTDWERFSARGVYTPPSLDSEGFLPLCSRDLAPVVANTIMIGGGDRLIVGIDSARLTSELRREPATPGTYAWPHVYGPLNPEAVMRVEEYSSLASGRFGPLSEAVRALDAGPELDGIITATDVLAVLDRLQETGLWFVLAGGWGVDALVGRQTRDHGDIDLCVRRDQLPAVIDALGPLDFALSVDQSPARVELRRAGRGSVDLHLLEIDPEGGCRQTFLDGSVFDYPPGDLAGKGEVVGRQLNCLTTAHQVRCHLGYEPGDNSYWNMALLHRQFGVALASPYDILC